MGRSKQRSLANSSCATALQLPTLHAGALERHQDLGESFTKIQDDPVRAPYDKRHHVITHGPEC
jgi:hypothetical protein